MSDAYRFGELVLVTGVAGLVALLAARLSRWTRVPAPLLLLVAAAVASNVFHHLQDLELPLVEHIVTVALIYILFDGGLSMGWARFRDAAVPIGVLGVVGTFLTVAGVAAFVHVAFGIDWFPALLVATAVSPTDPAVVFSVLGNMSGRAMTILAGESGANDPVGIALMAGLISAGAAGFGPFGHVLGEFALQMGVGAVVGLVGGRLLTLVTHRLPLESGALSALRVAMFLLPVFGVAVVAHGSGFLAVFIAGIVFGDENPPFDKEIEGFHTSLANLGEIVAFIVLGLTIDLDSIGHTNVWVPGLILGAVVSFVIRPILVGLCLLPSRLSINEKVFVLFAGLKGAVPILLGTMILDAAVPDATRLYGIVVVVVGFSVLVQGSLVPAVAGKLRL